MTVLGSPAALGRGVVVGAGGEAPPGTDDWPRVIVDDDAMSDAGTLADTLHLRWIKRAPVVIELRVDPDALRQPESCGMAPFEVGPSFEFSRERLQYLVWSNNYDARKPGDTPIWWHGRRALNLGAEAGVAGDVGVPGVGQVWCDGGPRGPISTPDGLPVIHRETIEAGSLRPESDRRASADLAEDQLKAVEHGAGPARIIAPAGSGKTRVLTERLRHLLADRGVTPGTVLAVAFNKRAADELVGRTAGLPAHIRTLNSLGLAIVNGSRPFGGTGEQARRVIDEREVRQILESLVSVRRQTNTDPWVAYLDTLSAIRLGLCEPNDVEEAIPDAAGIGEAFDPYREVLALNHLVDFDEQIYLAIELLLTRPDLRRQAQSSARHLLVDEFQDLTPAHLLLLRLLASPTYDVFGVGDDDQVIYSYAGASPEFLISYDKYFPGAATHALETNYRCPPPVVDAAAKLLAYNNRRVPKVISARRDRVCDESDLRVERLPSADHAEAALVEIRKWMSGGAELASVAVLTRVNASLLPIQVTLVEAGIPCTTPLGLEILERTGIKAALAYLRIGADPEHIARSDVTETVRRPSRRIARNVLDMLRRQTTTSPAGIRRLASALTGGDVEKLESYADDVELIAKAVRSGTTASALSAIRSQIGLGSAMDALDSSRREADRSTHLDDLRALEQVARLHPDPRTFEQWLRSVLSDRRSATSRADGGGEEAVTLSTVHRVKGQEWPYVIVLGATNEVFPHRLASDLEEERRIFHVAITRCSSEVVVLAGSEDPSVFCEEMYGRAPATTDRRSGRPGSRSTGGDDRLLPTSPSSTSQRGSRNRTGSAVGSGSAVAIGSRAADADREALSKALRQWRRETAERDKVPAFVVLSDAHLEGIAARRPATPGELAACRGIGPAKLERYGDDILTIVETTGSAADP